MVSVKRILLLTALGLAAMVTTAVAADLQPENKQRFEQMLLGDWAVPENKHETAITFNFTAERTFTCTLAAPKQDPVEWSGQWKVRTTKSGARAFLKGQNSADPDMWMKAVIRSNEAMDIFAVLITWDFKGEGRTWQSALEKQDGEAGTDEGSDGESMETDEEWSQDEETDSETPAEDENLEENENP